MYVCMYACMYALTSIEQALSSGETKLSSPQFHY